MKRKTKQAGTQTTDKRDQVVREVTDALLNAIVGGNGVRPDCKCHRSE